MLNSELDPRAVPHIRRRLIVRVLLKHQQASQEGPHTYRCTCAETYVLGKHGDGLARHQAEHIQRALDARQETSDGS